jgi:hypothetical protein
MMRKARATYRDPETRTAHNTRRRESASDRERIAAARARVAADKLRGVETERWIVELAQTAN